MNEIEKHVTSLELSKRLKELGCPQKSLFWWVQEGDLVTPVYNEEYTGLNPAMWDIVDQPSYGDDVEFIASAYLASELGEWLPEFVKTYKCSGDYYCCYQYIDNPPLNKDYARGEAQPKESDAKAKMLIWLIENGIVKFGNPLTHKTLEIEENSKKYRYDRGGFEPVGNF